MMLYLDVLLWMGAVAWVILALQGLINAYLVPDLSRLKAQEPTAWPKVSFVVPARNEEVGIRQAVTSFCTQDYPSFEVIVVNDRSTDDTGKILADLQETYANLVVVEGTDPPEGWLGKPNALEAGRAHATGEWVLMTDADALHAPDLLRRAMAFAEKEQADMVVVRPRHVSKGFLEAVLMSGVNFFFFVATPLFLVRLTRSALFATGSPVFNLMRTKALESVGGFSCLKQAVVDDLDIGFHIKRAGHRLAVAFAGALVGHRMYGGAQQTVCGFAKTTYPTIKRTPWMLPLYILVAMMISVLPYVGLVVYGVFGHLCMPAAVSLVLMHVTFAGIAWRYQEPWYITFTNPVRELGWVWIFVRSFVLYHRKGLIWRGRSYSTGA